MNKKILGLAILFALLTLIQVPVVKAQRQYLPGASDFWSMVKRFFGVIIGLIAIIAVIFIILGAFQFLTAGGDPEKAAQAKRQIIYAVVGLFIAAAAWALVNFVMVRIGAPETPF